LSNTSGLATHKVERGDWKTIAGELLGIRGDSVKPTKHRTPIALFSRERSMREVGNR
jgi:hypothetical protein